MYVTNASPMEAGEIDPILHTLVPSGGGAGAPETNCFRGDAPLLIRLPGGCDVSHAFSGWRVGWHVGISSLEPEEVCHPGACEERLFPQSSSD